MEEATKYSVVIDGFTVYKTEHDKIPPEETPNLKVIRNTFYRGWYLVIEGEPKVYWGVAPTLESESNADVLPLEPKRVILFGTRHTKASYQRALDENRITWDNNTSTSFYARLGVNVFTTKEEAISAVLPVIDAKITAMRKESNELARLWIKLHREMENEKVAL